MILNCIIFQFDADESFTICADCSKNIEKFYKFKAVIISKNNVNNHQSHHCRCCKNKDKTIMKGNYDSGNESKNIVKLFLSTLLHEEIVSITIK